ncbi:restriction endonuclease subunit S [Corynebacterium sp. Marseille-P8863]|uniref:restriction endonuclease subunit S n=1 Tax=Corynebacterium sp. Marseille-P8863 TaxID=2866576 RepID=UPI0022652AB0|nr:restriction endonuclease subunit S [Corynebacterium sp. Marseille-P8863]
MVTIRDLCISIGSGSTPSRKRPEFFVGDIPWLKTKELADATVFDTEEKISTDALEKSSCKLLPVGAVVMAMYGATVGKLGILGRKMATNQACCAMVTNPELLDSRYLFYWLKRNRREIQDLSTGAAQQNLSVRTIGAIEIEPPPVGMQIRISRVLGSLDDKIAANNRVIAVIDETILALWRASVSSKAAFVRLDDVVELNPRTSVPKGTVVRTIEMKHLPESGFSVKEWVAREAKGGSRFRNGDTLLARITPCFENGKCGYVDFLGAEGIGAGSTEFIVMRPQPGVPPAAPYSIARSTDFRTFAEQTMTGTSGRQRVQHGDLGTYETAWPDEDSLTTFGSATSPLLELAEKLRDENSSLAKTRDELLPLLMNGKITVREAKQEAAAAGAEILGKENEA